MPGIGMHHFNRRKRIHVKHEPFPHPNKWINFVDRAIYFVAVFGLLMTLPQIIRIWVIKDASGVSPISWASYLVIAVFWLVYGVIHKAKPIIFTNLLWILFDAVIVIGTVIY